MFQHTAARRRLNSGSVNLGAIPCFNTQPPEGGCLSNESQPFKIEVSTHSRPKAAGPLVSLQRVVQAFQHTAARRRLLLEVANNTRASLVSTHSRPKAAAIAKTDSLPSSLFQHTAARRRLFHFCDNFILVFQFQHTAARRRLLLDFGANSRAKKFQHTAARRRLVRIRTFPCFHVVSTHSRPKAAGPFTIPKLDSGMFQHTAARRRLVAYLQGCFAIVWFQHTAARRRLRFFKRLG